MRRSKMTERRRRFAKRKKPTHKVPKGVRGCVEWLLAAAGRAYEFAPSSYTFDAFDAAQAVAREIRKESTQPKS
jgi:hypothetical protein